MLTTAADLEKQLLRLHGDFDALIARAHTNPKIDWSRPTGRHRCTVSSQLREGAHRNVLHGAVRHLRDEEHLSDHQRLTRGVQEAHGVRIAPSLRYRLVHELRRCEAPKPRILSGVRRWRDGHPDDLLAEQGYHARVVSGQLDL